ncbi:MULTISPECIES: flagellar protein FlaG [Paenibacillus]|uniref:flagellar protein FlaG n=1 Tax=Paenibacillus TaxID=44249 RepID=UPI001780E973|nr:MULTISPECIES: flagellar protein FlaG [unclassified Paenibacillus]MBD8840693.1 flagellar protein FlaG [Paenibacillus sp. CFBP 13594]QZN76550.1 flagellar protein FlaG [Paenibacillus sp. DR312]
MNIELSLTANTTISRQHNSEYNDQHSLTAQSSPLVSNPKELKTSVVQNSVVNEQLVKTIERAIKSLEGPQTSLEISVHEKTHDIMVKVLNRETGELIREIPPEKTLDLVAKMMEIAGILIDEKI